MKKVRNLMLACTMLVFGLAGCNFDSDSPDSPASTTPVHAENPEDSGDNSIPIIPVNPNQPILGSPDITDTELVAAYDDLSALVDCAQLIAERAVEGDDVGDYSAGAVAELKEEIALAQGLLDADEVEKEVLKTERITLASLLLELITKKNLPSWSLSFERADDVDQSRVKIIWENDQDAISLSSIENYDSFIIDDVAAHIYWPQDANKVIEDEKTVIWAPAFSEEVFAKGFHVLTFRLLHDNKGTIEKWDFTFAYDLSAAAPNNEAITPLFIDIHLNKPTVEEVLPDFMDLISKAEDIATELDAIKDTDNVYYEAAAIAEFTNVLTEAKSKASSPSVTVKEITEETSSLSEAIKTIKAAKKIRMWNVEVTRRTDDQSTVKIIWMDEAYKLENAADAVIDEDGNHSFKAFKIDDVESHTYWPGNFESTSEYISLEPAFHEPSLHNGSHTLYFTLVKGEDEYEFEVPFTLNGQTNADEFEAEIENVKVSKVDPVIKARAKLQKQIDEITVLADKADAEKYQEGALDALKLAIATSREALTSSESVDDVNAAMEALNEAEKAFFAAKIIDTWEVEVLHRVNDQYSVIVTWAKDEYALNLDSAIGGNADFVTDGVPSHTYWPGDMNVVGANSVTWVPANGNFANENALGQHTLVFKLQPLGSDKRYELTVVYTLNATASKANIESLNIQEIE
ncbi:hypothetical protein MSI_12950 [Treponema sp. JC4]|uniref:hypothetical protein n=1 Tax=Treponema sp. JC4 TaxID=1124982 RepID=UPI00025B0C3C|nr:hypothetical protein [Treponema sp. JC4]EID85170.1 hypothetical protein MSI_12950 [Treponema sp. JC4]